MSIFPAIINGLRSHMAACFPKQKVCTQMLKPVQTSQMRTEYTWPGYGSRYGFTNWQMKKDYMKRQIVKEGFAERMRINAIRKNTILPPEIREIADKEVAALPRNSNPIRTVTRCVLTGRGRGTKKEYRVSRIMYKHFADYGKLSGVTRSTW